MKLLYGYTRAPIDNVHYDPRLAYSLHLAMDGEKGAVQSLNHNSGVLFALATENEDGSLNPMSLKHPRLFAVNEDTFGVLAIRTGSEGDPDESSKGCLLYWTTKDFLYYKEVGLVKLDEEYIAEFAVAGEGSEVVLQWKNEAGECRQAAVSVGDLKAGEKLAAGKIIAEIAGTVIDGGSYAETACKEAQKLADKELLDMEGAHLETAVVIPDCLAEYLQKKLMPPVHCGNTVPESVTVSNAEELAAVKVQSLYTDGQAVEKRVDWDITGVDFTKPGEYMAKGRIHQEHFGFPVAFNRADPCICYWEGVYYFIATNDADNNHTLYVRESDTMEGLVTAEEHLILDSSTYEGIGGLLWAPEFHEINGRLYIFHAATPGEFFCEESHIMELREGGRPSCREDWSAPKRVVKADGSDICEMGKEITLDMTCYEWEGSFYVIWSQRQFLPKDLGAWLYIAKLNPEKPWMLLSEPVVLSKPDYGWGNNHTFVEEGPFALFGKDKLFITFSAAAVDSSYVVSYLEIPAGKDLLVRENWKKNNYPILTSRSVKGEFGTGHNAYVTDEFGTIWNTYHARPGEEGVRSSGVRRVFFDVDGCPILDVTEDMDVAAAYANVEIKVIVK